MERIIHTKTAEYGCWRNMRSRCNNPNHPKYRFYGGRGITIDPAWNDYLMFLHDMGPRPSLRHSVDRIDNNGNYCKSNCRWATQSQQLSNRRSYAKPRKPRHYVPRPRKVRYDLSALKAEWDSGLSQRQLANAFNLTQPRICQIVKSNGWL